MKGGCLLDLKCSFKGGGGAMRETPPPAIGISNPGGGEEKKLSWSVGFLLFSSFFWVFVVVCVIGSSWQEKEGAPKGAQLQGW